MPYKTQYSDPAVPIVENILIKRITCPKCRSKWMARAVKPKKCPGCQTILHWELLPKKKKEELPNPQLSVSDPESPILPAH